MASGGGGGSGGGGYRNGVHKATVKVDRPLSAPSNLRGSSSFKSKCPPTAAAVRRGSHSSFGGAAKDDDSGQFRTVLSHCDL